MIRVRYADAPGTFSRVDFAAGCPDCHLVQIQPTQDRKRMEVHFTGCPPMLSDLLRVLDVRNIEAENDLLHAFCGEYRQAGLVAGVIREHLEQNALLALLKQTGRPVELLHAVRAEAKASAAEVLDAKEDRAQPLTVCCG